MQADAAATSAPGPRRIVGTTGAIAASELILGGQKSGKSRRAEELARTWLATASGRTALLIATASASDDEMRQRIARHQADRARRCPAVELLEEPLAIAQALREHSQPQQLLVVDCLTLWLTQLLWPGLFQREGDAAQRSIESWPAALEELVQAIGAARGPVVLVSNEIGLGVIPMGADVRAFVDALGQVNQAVATACSRVTLMAAGLPMFMKGTP